jgi:hypothetical protein
LRTKGLAVAGCTGFEVAHYRERSERGG